MDKLGQELKSVKLPTDLEQAIELGKNAVTSAELEANRLQKLAYEAKGELAKILEEKVSHEGSIKKIKADVEAEITVLAGIKAQTTQAEADLKNAQDNLSKINDEIESKRNVLVKRDQELDSREVSIKALEEDLNTRNIALIKSESDHSVKVEKLKKALE